MINMLHFVVEFYGDVTIFVYITVKLEIFTLLLVDMHIGMPGCCMGSWQCMY